MKMEKIVKRFYDELENQKFLGRKCNECGAVEFPPVLACNTCGGMDVEWYEVSGKGNLYDFGLPTSLGDEPMFEEFKPYVAASIELEEGVLINAPVLGITAEMTPELEEKVRAKQPVPVKMRGFKKKAGYSALVFELAEKE
jgi:uncharacterized OB-fold protein